MWSVLASGGNTVTISGSNLTLTTAVHFGPGTATGISVVSDSQITANAPAGSGSVTVTTPGGTSMPGLGNACPRQAAD
ncbi:IPT/TIG domain-containing protein [Streptomyces sp. NPDC057565]|uniref:IPT/TIG domain-containing protein n=1 Tax=Streptomyces sp. NPDC057565 TaxID=3346169 RepID=UPI003678EAFF